MAKKIEEITLEVSGYPPPRTKHARCLALDTPTEIEYLSFESGKGGLKPRISALHRVPQGRRVDALGQRPEPFQPSGRDSLASGSLIETAVGLNFVAALSPITGVFSLPRRRYSP
jgi:hypothetical protein